MTSADLPRSQRRCIQTRSCWLQIESRDIFYEFHEQYWYIVTTFFRMTNLIYMQVLLLNLFTCVTWRLGGRYIQQSKRLRRSVVQCSYGQFIPPYPGVCNLFLRSGRSRYLDGTSFFFSSSGASLHSWLPKVVHYLHYLTTNLGRYTLDPFPTIQPTLQPSIPPSSSPATLPIIPTSPQHLSFSLCCCSLRACASFLASQVLNSAFRGINLCSVTINYYFFYSSHSHSVSRLLIYLPNLALFVPSSYPFFVLYVLVLEHHLQQ